MAEQYAIYGKLYETDGSTAVSGATVKLRHERTQEKLTFTTSSTGEFMFNLGDLTEGWSDGDVVTLYVIYTNYEKAVSITIDTSTYSARYEQNLTLVAVTTEPQLNLFNVQEFLDTFGLVTYDSDNERGIKVDIIINVGKSIEAAIEDITNRKWDNNSGNYTTATNEYHNATGAPATWPESVGSANVSSQKTYFTKHTPIQSLTTFEVNKNSPNSTADWETLTEEDNQIKVKNSIGRIEITDASDYPAAGKDQVRITYTYGESSVPEDIKRLAILMTGRALAKQSLQNLNINASEFSGLSSAVQNLAVDDNEIDEIIKRRKFKKVRRI